MAELSIFVPKNIIPLADGSANFRASEGTILFCDVAGFTPLTETLSRSGKEGSEQLTSILNRYFSAMIEIVYGHGGDVLRFGGDAMTVFFPKGSERQAADCACRMMVKMGDFGHIKVTGGTFSLAMKIGIAYGETLFGIVGCDASGYDYYAAGSPLDASAEAEHMAAKGIIVSHPSFPAAGQGPVKPLDSGFQEIVPADWLSSAAKQPRRSKTEEGTADIGRLIPPYLVDRAGEGTLGEHRSTTVVFISFKGLETGAVTGSHEMFHERLDLLYRHLASTAKNYGGTLNKIDMGDKGMKAILLFGSPYALENKEEMAVRCAMDIRDKNPLAGTVSLRMGVTTAPLFTGPVGSPERREFTVMGDGINTSARFMQKAGDDMIYCDARTRELSSGEVLFTELEPLELKGKEKKVPAFVPVRLGRMEQLEGPVELIERNEAAARIKRLIMNDEKPVLVQAGAGLGKTAVIEWAKKEADALRIPTTRVFLAPYHKARPYSLWKGALRSLIGAQKNDGPGKLAELRDLAVDPGYRNYSALLNPLIGMDEEEREAYRHLSAKDRKELTFALVEKLLSVAGERLLISDNLENADPLSLELLNFVLQGGQNRKMKILCSVREVSQYLERLSMQFDRVELLPLSGKGVEMFLERTLKKGTLSETALDFFRAKSGGNPKLLAAILEILKDRNIISVDHAGNLLDEDRLFSTPFPEKLEDLYLKKVDELEREEREVVQVASVLGYSVSIFLLSFASGRSRQELMEKCEQLVRKDIFNWDTWGDKPYMRFRESFLREAVYNTAPFSLKRDIHLKCAQFLEKESGGNRNLWNIIADHFRGGGDEVKALEYYRKCAYDALGRFDNVSAFRFLEEVCGGGIKAENADCAFSLLEVYGNLGKTGEEFALLEKLEPLMESLPPRDRLRLLSFQTKRAVMRRDADKAEELFRVSERLAISSGDNMALAKIYVNQAGGLYGPRGELDKAKGSLDKCLALPDSPDTRLQKITAMFNNANILRHRGMGEEALALFKNAYNKAARLKLLPQMATVAGSIAGLLYARGDGRGALVWNRRARRFSETLGLRQILLHNDHLLAIIEHAVGRSEASRERLVKNVERCRRFNNQMVEAISLDALVDVNASLLDLSGAIECGSASLVISRRAGDEIVFKNTLVELLKTLYIAGDREEAARIVRREGWQEAYEKCQPMRQVDDMIDILMGWVSGKDFSFDPGRHLCIEERFREEHLFLCAEESVRSGRKDEAARLVGELRADKEAGRREQSRSRLFLLMSLLGDPGAGELLAAVTRSLEEKPFGVHGLRALGAAWSMAGPGSQRRKVRRLFIARLYRFRARSPEWAFGRIVALEEVRAALAGEP